MILKKSSNNDLEVLATKSGPWAFYKTKTAANNDLANIPEGSIVAIEEASSTTIDSLPVGTWASFENTDSAPNSQWIKAGATFDEDDYPELYLYLGTNIVPERFDHSRLGKIENITSSQFTAPYDGIITIYGTVAGRNEAGTVKANNVVIARVYRDSTTSAAAFINKGDAITFDGFSWISPKVAYYTKPLFIKSKSFVEEYVPNAAIETVKDYTKSYVNAKNSYSTTETLTGGTWIDGKPIYKRTFVLPSFSSTEGIVDSSGTYDKIISQQGHFIVNGTQMYPIAQGRSSDSISLSIPNISNHNLGYIRHSGVSSAEITIEYTKTTD